MLSHSSQTQGGQKNRDIVYALPTLNTSLCLAAYIGRKPLSKSYWEVKHNGIDYQAWRHMSNLINKDEFTATRASCDAEIEELQSIIESVDKQREMIEQQQQLLKEIEDAIKEIVSGVEYEDEFYKHILDKMVVQDKDNIDVYLNLLPMKWSYTVAKASKKAVASEWNISEASLPISVSRPRCSSNGME